VAKLGGEFVVILDVEAAFSHAANVAESAGT